MGTARPPADPPRRPQPKTATMEELDDEQLETLKKAFTSFDTEGKGRITTETVGVILRMMGIKLSEKNLMEIVAEVDVGGSGMLDFEGFAELCQVLGGGRRGGAEERTEGSLQDLRQRVPRLHHHGRA